VINGAVQHHRGDQVYAAALLATLLSFAIDSVVHVLGERFDWRGTPPGAE
jgi:hypothetical protein